MTLGPRPPPFSFGEPHGDRPPPPSFVSTSLPYPVPNDARAVLALALGIVSLFTCGLTGIPAVALGFTARSAIQRSGGMLRGDGLATGGIATGLAGTAMGMVALAVVVAGIVFGARGGPTASHHGTTAPVFGPGPAPTTAWSPAAPSVPPAATTIGSLRMLDLDPDAKRTFHQQLMDEYKRASGDHATVILMTNARRCSVCREFEASLTDPRMQAALAHVDLVRVDIEDFEEELRANHMFEDTLPWFYKLDSTLHPVDAISAGEWDENVPENMAPVLKSFIAGTLRQRREPSQVGTAL